MGSNYGLESTPDDRGVLNAAGFQAGKVKTNAW